MTRNRSDWPQLAVRPRDDWYVTMDVGQAVDPSAICCLNHVVAIAGEGNDAWYPDDKKRVWRQAKTERFHVIALKRLPLHTSYPDQVDYVADILSRDPFRGATFGIDYTGVGRPVADMFERAGLKPHCVLATGGNEITSPGGRAFNVPKLTLVSGAEVRLHSGELRFAPDLQDAETLREELKNFARKVSESGRVSYDAKSGKHDDLIAAICIGIFLAGNRSHASSEELRV
jgi:hypothetical protein